MTRPDPVWDGYFADPAVVRTDDGYVAYGTDPTRHDGFAFAVLTSPDLITWRAAAPVLRIDPAVGTDHWAPEVVRDGDDWFLFFSAGHGITGHHLRVAHADGPLGPFTDTGLDLSPGESFAIDAHPFVDADGQRYLYFARDVLGAEHPGTHLAVQRMRSWTEPDGDVGAVLQPNALWQRYEADRDMYGRRRDWYTLEGPSVIRRDDEYVLFYSGGSWEGPDYGVATATSADPLGPWIHRSDGSPDVLSSSLTGLAGPGHNSTVDGPDGRTWIAFHAWDDAHLRRRPFVLPVGWFGSAPVVDTGASGSTAPVAARRSGRS